MGIDERKTYELLVQGCDGSAGNYLERLLGLCVKDNLKDMDKGQNSLAIKLRVEVYCSYSSHSNVELNHDSRNNDRGIK